MNRKLLTLAAVMILLGATGAMAQSATDFIDVTANNNGVFTFAITQTSFDFGTVDAAGTTSTTGVTATPGTGGATYTKAGAASWTCTSAPKRTVAISEASTTHTGLIPANQLAIEIPAVSGGSSAGYKSFGSGASLITGIANVGNGTNAVSGAIDFQLTVNDVDATGANSWTVVLTASGT